MIQKEHLIFSAFVVALVVVVIVAASVSIRGKNSDRSDCSARDGQYVDGGRGGDDWCVDNNGIVVKIYR